MKTTIIVYSKPDCQQCRLVKRLLDREEVDYQEIDVTEDAESMALLKEKGFRGVPVTRLGETFVLGFSPDQIEALI